MLGVVFQDSVLDKPLTVKETQRAELLYTALQEMPLIRDYRSWSRFWDFDEFLNRPRCAVGRSEKKN